MAAKSNKNNETTALLGAGSYLEGNFTFDGTGRIDGSFKGEINSKDLLIVGAQAEIEGTVHVCRVMIEGVVKGNLIATEEVTIHASGKVFGDIESPALIIERGAQFNGVSKMSALPEPIIKGKKDKK